MASPLALGLAAAFAMSSTAALACEGQGCWGMAPAQEKNPGYTGPDYGAMQAAPGGPGDYGPDAYVGDQGPPDDGQGYGGTFEYAQGYGPGDEGADGAPGYGPPDAGPDQSYAGPDQSYGSPPEDHADEGMGEDGPPMGPEDGYGPPPAYEAEDDGEAAGYGAPPVGSGPHGPPPVVQGGAYAASPSMHHGGYAHHAPDMEMHGGPAWMTEPYEGSYDRGYEASRQWTDAYGARNRSYRSGSKRKYVYDSGWRIQEGPSEVHVWGTPLPPPSYSVRSYGGVSSHGFMPHGGRHHMGPRHMGPHQMGPGHKPPHHAGPPPVAHHAPPPPPPAHARPMPVQPGPAATMAPIPNPADDGERG